MKSIICDGTYSEDNNRYLINMSSIYSLLIRECGRLVDEYNSDLLVDIASIDRYISNVEDGAKVFWIGLRDSGVDGFDFIKCRTGNDCYYREIFKLTVEKTQRKCVVTLKKSSLYDFREENGIERT